MLHFSKLLLYCAHDCTLVLRGYLAKSLSKEIDFYRFEVILSYVETVLAKEKKQILSYWNDKFANDKP